MMNELSEVMKIVSELTLTGFLFWAWFLERKDHRQTRIRLARANARHKSYLEKALDRAIDQDKKIGGAGE